MLLPYLLTLTVAMQQPGLPTRYTVGAEIVSVAKKNRLCEMRRPRMKKSLKPAVLYLDGVGKEAPTYFIIRASYPFFLN